MKLHMKDTSRLVSYPKLAFNLTENYPIALLFPLSKWLDEYLKFQPLIKLLDLTSAPESL